MFRRADAGSLQALSDGAAPAPLGELTHPVIHVSSVPIPNDAADYGSDIVGTLGPDDAFIVVKEFDSAEATQALFARVGVGHSLTEFLELFFQRVEQMRELLAMLLGKALRFIVQNALGQVLERLAEPGFGVRQQGLLFEYTALLGRQAFRQR